MSKWLFVAGSFMLALSPVTFFLLIRHLVVNHKATEEDR